MYQCALQVWNRIICILLKCSVQNVWSITPFMSVANSLVTDRRNIFHCIDSLYRCRRTVSDFTFKWTANISSIGGSPHEKNIFLLKYLSISMYLLIQKYLCNVFRTFVLGLFLMWQTTWKTASIVKPEKSRNIGVTV